MLILTAAAVLGEDGIDSLKCGRAFESENATTATAVSSGAAWIQPTKQNRFVTNFADAMNKKNVELDRNGIPIYDGHPELF